MASVCGSQIALQVLGTGEYVPCRRVESSEFDERWSKESGWTYSHTGVRSRAFVGGGEDAITMGVAAARDALKAARLRADQLDVIISIGSVPYQAIPCTAVFLQRAMGLGDSGITAFDINSTCLGFIVALDLVAQGIATGRFRNVLIIASEPASGALNWDDTLTAGLFGDGAGAVVIGAAQRDESLLSTSFVRTYGKGLEFCQIRGGGSGLNPRTHLDEFLTGTVFEMKGRPTFKLAAELLPPFLATLLERAGVSANDIDVWVPHQGSGHALSHLQASLGLPAERMVLTLETHGNQVSASLPIALHRGIDRKQIVPGSVIALLGAGAGMSLGGAVLTF
jgi:3-oxoacyl-[acyl-carrier-protein] synthase-3